MSVVRQEENSVGPQEGAEDARKMREELLVAGYLVWKLRNGCGRGSNVERVASSRPCGLSMGMAFGANAPQGSPCARILWVVCDK